MTQIDFEAEEMEYVETLRKNLKGIMSPEMYADTSVFIRFIRARNYDLKAAENMLRNHVIWRKNNKIDTLLSWYTPEEVAEKYISFSLMCFDKEGSPVIYSNFGNIDTRGCLKSMKLSSIQNYFTHLFEYDMEVLKAQSEKLKKPVNQWVYVLNFETFSLATATHKSTLETVGKMVSIYEANYPELLKAAIIFNASWYFQIGFAVIKPLFTGHTLQKIKIFGKTGWKEELLEHIDADQLPAFLGGNRTDPDGDPMCKTFVKHGGIIPEKYFLNSKKKNFMKQEGVKKLAVNRLSKEEVELIVLHPGSNIEWEFETKKHDIAVSLLYKEHSNEEIKEVMPKQRFDTSMCSEVGLFKCDKAGFYYLQFDNTYSWVHTKEVYYKAQVIISNCQTTADPA